MTERARPRPSDEALETALRDLATALAGPEPGDVDHDPARLARIRIARGAGPVRGRGRGGVVPSWSPLRRPWRSLVLAIVALVLLAVAAGAIGFGLPGIRIVLTPTASAGASPAIAGPSSFVPPSPSGSSEPASPVGSRGAGAGSPGPSGPAALGADLGLGDEIPVADAAGSVDVPIRLPDAPGIGTPATAWLLDGRLSLVWPSSAQLPATREPGIGLILAEFRASVDPGYFEKVLEPGTTIEPVSIGGATGWWISGAPHVIVFIDAAGQPVFDSRRIVGNTLLWAAGDVTYRLESGLGRDGAIALAERLR